jgi:hypothetical protein
VSQPSKHPEASHAISDSSKTTDMKERVRMIGKLFSMYPLAGNQDAKAAQVAYLEATLRLPVAILKASLGRITQRESTRFVPPVGEILAEGARVIRKHLPRSANGFAHGYNPHSDGEESVGRIEYWLDKAHLVELPANAGPVMAIAQRASQRMGRG